MPDLMKLVYNCLLLRAAIDGSMLRFVSVIGISKKNASDR